MLSIFKKIIKTILKPFYQPIRVRYEDKLIKIDDLLEEMQSEQKNCIETQNDLQKQLLQIEQKLDGLQKYFAKNNSEILAEIIDNSIVLLKQSVLQQVEADNDQLAKNIRHIVDVRVEAAERCINQITDARIWKAEQNVNQTMDGRIWQAEQNINQTTDTRIWKTEQNINQITDARIWQAEQSFLSSIELQAYKNLKLVPQTRLERLTVHLVEHCNLNCQCCDNFSPVAEPEFVSFENLARDFEQLAKIGGGRYLYFRAFRRRGFVTSSDL